MNRVLLDTHAWAWSLAGDQRLSAKSIGIMEQAAAVLVSPISFFEIGQKVRIGKWPEMVPFANRLPALLEKQGGSVATLSPDIALAAATMDWSHRDPFDRILAATAIDNRIPLISADTVFDELRDRDGWISRLW